MDQQKDQHTNTNTPWNELREDQQRKVLDSFVLINGERVKISDHDDRDQLVQSLTPSQIEEILDGKLVSIDWRSSSGQRRVATDDAARHQRSRRMARSINLSIDICPEVKRLPVLNVERIVAEEPLPKPLSPFDELDERQKQQIFHSTVQIPGQMVPFWQLIELDMQLCQLLTRDDIDKMLNNEVVTFFEGLVTSLENFVQTRGGTSGSDAGSGSNLGASNGDPGLAPGIGSRFTSRSENSSNDDDDNNNDDSKSTQAPTLSIARVLFRGLNQFLETFENNRTMLLLKASASDPVLFRMFMTLEAIYKLNKAKRLVLFFYRDFSRPEFIKILHEISESGKLSIVKQLELLQDPPLTVLEQALLRIKFSNDSVLFMMDNVENVSENKELLLEIIREIQTNLQGVQKERNQQLIVTNKHYALMRQQHFGCPCYCFERQELDEIDGIEGLTDLGFNSMATRGKNFISMSLVHFHPE
jgi:hypothetical protein